MIIQRNAIRLIWNTLKYENQRWAVWNRLNFDEEKHEELKSETPILDQQLNCWVKRLFWNWPHFLNFSYTGTILLLQGATLLYMLGLDKLCDRRFESSESAIKPICISIVIWLSHKNLDILYRLLSTIRTVLPKKRCPC